MLAELFAKSEASATYGVSEQHCLPPFWFISFIHLDALAPRLVSGGVGTGDSDESIVCASVDHAAVAYPSREASRPSGGMDRGQ